MSEHVNVKESFVQLLKNNEIWDGRIITNPFELPNNQIQVSMSFNEISQFEDEFTFYDDNEDEDRGDKSGILVIDFKQVDTVVYVEGFLDEHGKYNAMLHFKDNTQVLISFNMKDRKEVPKHIETAVNKIHTFEERLSYEKTYQSYCDEQNDCINGILSHKGLYLINFNSSDFVEESSGGFEAFNLVFTSIKQLNSKRLLSFDNSEEKPIRFTDKNVPVYSMGSSSNFYIKVGDITLIEELKAEDYQDVFEYPTKKIFNLHMTNESIITIGLFE